jgi:hypothetical protein
MDKSVHNIICKLKVLSKIESGENLMVDEISFKILDCKKHRWDRFIKWWLGEDRYRMANKLSGFHTEIRDTISILIQDPVKNITNIDRLFGELANSIKGLDNLIKTYTGDKTITSQLETLRENFNLEINRLIDALSDDTNRMNNAFLDSISIMSMSK